MLSLSLINLIEGFAVLKKGFGKFETPGSTTNQVKVTIAGDHPCLEKSLIRLPSLSNMGMEKGKVIMAKVVAMSKDFLPSIEVTRQSSLQTNSKFISNLCNSSTMTDKSIKL